MHGDSREEIDAHGEFKDNFENPIIGISIQNRCGVLNAIKEI